MNDALFNLAYLVIAGVCIGLILMDIWARRRNILPQPPGGHVHTGVERSRHEVGGRQVIVFECRDCLMRFSGEV